MRVTLKPTLDTGERRRVWLAGGTAPGKGKREKGPKLRLPGPWSTASIRRDELRSERPGPTGRCGPSQGLWPSPCRNWEATAGL